jgi:hypothetical protein
MIANRHFCRRLAVPTFQPGKPVDFPTPPSESEAAGGDPPWRTKMFARQKCSKVGCFLEAALPIVAPAIGLLSMLSLAAFS